MPILLAVYLGLPKSYADNQYFLASDTPILLSKWTHLDFPYSWYYTKNSFGPLPPFTHVSNSTWLGTIFEIVIVLFPVHRWWGFYFPFSGFLEISMPVTVSCFICSTSILFLSILWWVVPINWYNSPCSAVVAMDKMSSVDMVSPMETMAVLLWCPACPALRLWVSFRSWYFRQISS